MTAASSPSTAASGQLLLDVPGPCGHYAPADDGLRWQPLPSGPQRVALPLVDTPPLPSAWHWLDPMPDGSPSPLTVAEVRSAPERRPAQAMRLDSHHGSTVVPLAAGLLPGACRAAPRQVAAPAIPTEQLLSLVWSPQGADPHHLRAPHDRPTHRQRISAWPADQQALHWHRQPPEQAMEAGLPPPITSTHASRERNGQAADPSAAERWYALDQQLHQGLRRWADLWRGPALQDIRIQSRPRVFTGSGSMAWGHAFDPPRSVLPLPALRRQPPPLRWWARWSLIPFQLEIQLTARLVINDAQAWLTLRVPEAPADLWCIDQCGSLPLSPGDSLPTHTWHTDFRVGITPVVTPSAVLLTASAVQTGPAVALQARVGLRHEGPGLALFAQAECGPLSLPVHLRDPWRGEQRHELCLPRVRILDWSLDQ